jgi:hypothetical protein
MEGSKKTGNSVGRKKRDTEQPKRDLDGNQALLFEAFA